MPAPVIHLFKPGTHIDMGGQQISFGEADLQASVDAYDPALHEAPLCIGHPKHDAPAYGWVQSMRMAADGPEAIPHQVNADFAEMHKVGAFKKVSASFYTPNNPHNPVPGVYYLRHVAFLGAQPPAIKGLRAVEFAESDDCITIEFSESPEEAPAADEPPVPPLAATPEPEPQQQEDAAVSSPLSPEEVAELVAKNKEQEQQLKEERALRLKEKADRAHADNVAFCESLAKDTRIGKDDVDVMAAALDALQSQDTLNFGEGKDAQPLHQVFKDRLTAMPPRVEFGEHAKGEDAADGEDDGETVEYAEGTPDELKDMDKEIRAYAKANKVDYTQAAHAVYSRK